jgi:hypothetical protein
VGARTHKSGHKLSSILAYSAEQQHSFFIQPATCSFHSYFQNIWNTSNLWLIYILLYAPLQQPIISIHSHHATPLMRHAQHRVFGHYTLHEGRMMGANLKKQLRKPMQRCDNTSKRSSLTVRCLKPLLRRTTIVFEVAPSICALGRATSSVILALQTGDVLNFLNNYLTKFLH